METACLPSLNHVIFSAAGTKQEKRAVLPALTVVSVGEVSTTTRDNNRKHIIIIDIPDIIELQLPILLVVRDG